MMAETGRNESGREKIKCALSAAKYTQFVSDGSK
jgi:hypothetical protein